jgi:hypothetical protein
LNKQRDTKPIDQRGKLQEDAFDCQITKDKRVLLFWCGKHIKTFKGTDAEKLIQRLDALDDIEVQLVLAKATGNFKRGNERR